MNRRNFLLRSGAALCAASVGALPLSAKTIPRASLGKREVGIQLFSLYEQVETDLDSTLQQLSNLGFKSIEGYGLYEGKLFGSTPSAIQKKLSLYGMRLTSTHTSIAPLFEDTPQNWDYYRKDLEALATSGATWIVQAGYPGEHYRSLDEVKHLADRFNRVGEEARKAGLRFAYHNHREEFRAIEGRIPYQEYLLSTDPATVTFQLDTGHAANEMADYIAYLTKYPGRFRVLHLRDVDTEKKEATCLGTGDVRFSEVFSLMDRAGVEAIYVEQEHHNGSPFRSMEENLRYLRQAKR